MTDQERIAKLEKKVKNLQTVNYIRFAIVALGFIGVTSYFMDKLKKLK